MRDLVFATGNKQKFQLAEQVMIKYGIALSQRSAKIHEIQSEDALEVASDKAEKTYAILKVPLVISDVAWSFNGLKGFPGIYMHSMNDYLSPEDFLRLMSTVKDRSITLTRYVVYIDGQTTKV